MEKLLEKIENLIESINNTEEIIKLKSLNEELMKDNELLHKIKLFNETKDEKLKEKIINHPLLSEYRHSETDCNLLIMGINQKLKKAFDKDKDGNPIRDKVKPIDKRIISSVLVNYFDVNASDMTKKNLLETLTNRYTEKAKVL